MSASTDDPRFELFSYWRSSAVFRVRVAFGLKGVKARETNVDIEGGEQHGELFRRVNPLGGIPALVDHGDGQPALPMTQSLALLEFIDETYPEPPLLPRDAHGRARVRALAQMLAADTHPLVTPRVRQYLTTTGGFDAAAWRAWQVQWFGTGLRAVEKRLSSEDATGRFCHGDQLTIADICLASIFAVMRVFKIDFDDIPTLKRIVAECDRLDAFAAAAPERQAGAPKPAPALPSFADFQLRAIAAGADEVLERHWQPLQVVDTHAHPFEADALVTAGEMWLTCGGDTRHLRPGDTFKLAAGAPHAERYGPQGATYWVARRNPR